MTMHLDILLLILRIVHEKTAKTQVIVAKKKYKIPIMSLPI